MLQSMLRFFGIRKDKKKSEDFDPIYGLPKQSLDDWLSRNPSLRKQHEAELLARSLRNYRRTL